MGGTHQLRVTGSAAVQGRVEADTKTAGSFSNICKQLRQVPAARKHLALSACVVVLGHMFLYADLIGQLNRASLMHVVLSVCRTHVRSRLHRLD